MGNQQLQRDWRIAGIITAALVLLTLVLYKQTLVYLTGYWNELETGAYAHGYLVLAICIYLIIRSRPTLFAINPCPDYLLLIAVLAASLLWLVSALVGVQVVEAVALLLLLFSIVWAVLGKGIARVLVFPILFIIFAIPIWFPLTTILQDLTADVVFEVIRTLRIPAFRQENMIIVPAGTLSIEEACSGMRYFLAAITLGALYGYLNYKTLFARIIVIAVTAAAGVLANIIRVFIVVYLGYATDMQHPLIHDHFMLGWYLFGALVVILIFVDTRLYRRRESTATNAEANLNKAFETKPVACQKGKTGFFFVLTVGAMLLSTGPAAVYSINHYSKINHENVHIELPSGIGGWTGPAKISDNWMPVYHGAINRKQAYSKGAENILVYIGYYPSQRQGEELITFHNRISDGDIWKESYTRARITKIENGHVLEQLLENKAGVKRLVWYWHNVANRVTVNTYEAKVLQLLGLLTGEPQAFVVAVAIDVNDDVDYTRKVLQEFCSTMDVPLNNINVISESINADDYQSYVSSW